MVYGRQPTSRGPLAGGLGGLSGPVPRDIVVLLAVVFATFSLDILTGGWLGVLRLTSAVWTSGYVWQLATYAFTGFWQLHGVGVPALWILLELLILFWFGKDVFWRLGRKRFWRTLAWGVLGGGLTAAAADLVLRLAGFAPLAAFAINQGQRTLIAILIAAFATLYADATIYLFFVLPLRARWFLWLEILFAFVAFLGTRDLPGFAGICAAVGVTWAVLRHGGPGGPRRAWLRLRQRWLQRRLERERRKRGFKVVRGGDGPVNRTRSLSAPPVSTCAFAQPRCGGPG
jgi:hypothetical protein